MLEIEQLKFKWKNQDNWQINIEHLLIQKGEHVFLQGGSGTGKSTLLGIISGINLAQYGEVKILNTSLSDLSPAKRDRFRADHIGYIFQQFNLLPYLSVIENVILPCHFSKIRQSRIQGNMLDEAKRLLSALDLDCIDKSVSELSIGQQQRVAAARALIGRPELILADEPTSSLDYDAKESFLSLLLNECSKTQTTIIFVSHDRSLQSLFDKTIDLKEINNIDC